jgi:hypothetical protein
LPLSFFFRILEVVGPSRVQARDVLIIYKPQNVLEVTGAVGDIDSAAPQSSYTRKWSPGRERFAAASGAPKG